ncbi:hypothetical protein ACIQH5_12545 [Paenarthrobacter sp. NPDC091711]|uniref:hypothetical protein n=1 Tax=Paenarthrobacter sp. NPDC091711 TaxID=3364385 RepID=UPI003828D0F9
MGVARGAKPMVAVLQSRLALAWVQGQREPIHSSGVLPHAGVDSGNARARRIVEARASAAN